MADNRKIASKYTARFLLELHRKAITLSETELYEYFLNHAVKITKSKIGFFHFVSDDQKETKLTAWNKEALRTCNANYQDHYPMTQAGNWADSIRLKHPIIYNQFKESPNQKGLPEGHASVKRILTVPILENDKARAIFGVGNKTHLYRKEDIRKLELVARELNNIIQQRQAENELRESKEKYHSLFANMLDGFAYCKMIFNKEGKPVDFVYLEVNDAFEALTGLKKEIVVGKNVTEAIPGIKEANPELFEIYGRVASSGKQEKFDVFFKPLGIWLAISVYSPQKGYFAAVFDNITEPKKAEEALRAVEWDLNRAQAVGKIGSWRLDTQRNFLLWSDENHRIFGVPKGTHMTYEAFLNIVHPEDTDYVDHEWKAGLTGKPYDIEHRIIVDGKVKWVREKAELEFDRDGKLRGGFGTSQEITDFVEMRHQLEDASAQLLEYAKNMEQLAKERADKLKDAERLAAIGATAGMVGHDIRNPLQAITSDVYLAKTELASTPDTEEKKNAIESLGEIEKNIDYINKIVQDLQDYARPINPKVEEGDLRQIVESLFAKSGLPENIETKIEVAEGTHKIMVDAYYLKRILFNLVTNAVQAMPQGGKLTVRAHKEGNDTVITVSDTGIGIPKAIQEKMFTLMFTTKSKGQGFGLPVVKRMTESLGGTVTFESQGGKGTTFLIRLPPPKELNGKLVFK